MNCCDAWGKCTRGANCPAREVSQAKGRAIESEGFTFGTADIDKEAESDFTNPLIATVVVVVVVVILVVSNLIFN